MDSSDVYDNVEEHNEHIQEDYALVRKLQHDLLMNGMEILPKLTEVCKQSEHPRAFEVLSKLSKDLSDIGDKLLEHHRKKQVIDTDTAMNMLRDQEDTQAIENQTREEQRFIGSVDEMQKRIQDNVEKRRREKKADAIDVDVEEVSG